MKILVIPIVVGVLEKVLNSQRDEGGEVENQRKNRGHPDHCIVKIVHSTQNNSDDLKRLLVT